MSKYGKQTGAKIILVINKGWKGPHLVNILKVPKSTITNWICPQALIRNCNSIINHKTHKTNTMKNTKQSKKSLSFLPYRAPVEPLYSSDMGAMCRCATCSLHCVRPEVQRLAEFATTYRGDIGGNKLGDLLRFFSSL